ncbi:hypothetical protein QQP08_009061 [Theobroma cacao]|nr:hypothetical protein QQP08_009061 [Theobroma cacao]
MGKVVNRKMHMHRSPHKMYVSPVSQSSSRVKGPAILLKTHHIRLHGCSTLYKGVAAVLNQGESSQMPHVAEKMERMGFFLNHNG